MAKQNNAVEKNSNKNGRIKTKPPTVAEQSDDQLGLVRSSEEFNPIGLSDSVQTQASCLGDLQLQKIQRQEIATLIGQTQGNRHLGKVTSAISDIHDKRTLTKRRNISSIPNQTNMPIQMLRSGSVGGVHFNESSQDVIGIRMSYQIGELDTILENINRVVQQFGSSSRNYTEDINFQLMLRSFLQEIGHPSVSGGRPVMTRQRSLRLRIRLIRGAGRRINGLELLRPQSEIEVETPQVVEGRQQPEPRSAPEPTQDTAEQTPTEETAATAEQGGILSSIASGAETLGNIVSARWAWDRIIGQLAEWEGELDRIGEQGSPTVLGSILIVPVSILFTILSSIVGLLDLLARLNPGAQALHTLARNIRIGTGEYTQADFIRDAEAVGGEALDIITLGLRNAFRHLREGYEEANAFRITQALSEIALAAMAIFGVFRSIRVRSSAGRMAVAVAEERAAPAAPVEPTPPGEPVRPTAPTELAPAEPVRPSAPSEPARPGQPGRRSGGAAGRPRVERVFNTEEVARQVRDSYMSGEARGGWDAAFSQESLQAHWEGIGGRGRAPLAFVDTNGYLVFDANRLGMPRTSVVAEGTARRMARRPSPPRQGQEPVRGTAPTEQAPAAESVRPTAPTEQAAAPEPVRPTAPTEQAATPEPVRPTAPTEQAAAPEPVRPTAPTEQAAAPEPSRPAAPAEPARTSTPAESSVAQGRPRLDRVFETEEAARQIRDQYMSGEVQGGWDAALSQESLQAHWEGIGGEGPPPLAFMDTNGSLVFDARRIGLPPERMVAEGTARRMARRPPPQPPQIYEPIAEVARARLAIQDWVQNGDPVIRHWTTDAMQNAWERAGGEGTAPVAYVKDNGVLVVNLEALRGQ